MKVVCAFPTSGKTHFVKQMPLGSILDLDYGKIRDMFGVSFAQEKDRGKNVISTFYKNSILAARYSGVKIVLTNEPHISYDRKAYEVIFVIPSFSATEWLNRIKRRGDDLNADWVKYIYKNFNKCIEDWKDHAEKCGYTVCHLDESHKYLSDLEIFTK